METVDLGDAQGWLGIDVFDQAGERIGRLIGIYVDPEFARPEFGLVRTGLFGLRTVLVPFARMFEEGEALIVDLEKKTIKGSPQLRRDEPLSEQTERELYAHYGLEPASSAPLELWQPEPERRRR